MCVDLQHGVGGPQNILPFLQGMSSFPEKVPVVRAAGNDAATVGHILDSGARAVIMPMINTRSDADEFIASCRYSPEGQRSLAPLRAELLHNRRNPQGPSYLVSANKEIVTMAMIETSDGLNSCEEIAATPGLDALFIGPFDLGVALGVSAPGVVLGEDESNRELREAIEHVKRTAHAAGLKAAIFCNDGASARGMAAAGFDFVSVGNDANHLRNAAAAELEGALKPHE